MLVRDATLADLEPLAAMRHALWPDGSVAEHLEDARATLSDPRAHTLPVAIFVAADGGGLRGFVDVSLRSTVDDCDPSRVIGFLEGWYVAPSARRQGLGRRLVEAAEAWVLAQGCDEIGSDTWVDNDGSVKAHAALGFEVVDRCVNFRKRLREPTTESAFYGRELARIHHDHFGAVARGAAEELLQRLGQAGRREGRVVDLGSGSGLLSRAVTDAGFSAWGVDLSQDMVALARTEAPSATFTVGSVWDVALPPCVAVAAVGEVFNYAADPSAGLQALESRLNAIHEALVPGGVLLFDVAGPGRSGPARGRQAFTTRGEAQLGLEEQESEGRLIRTISLYLPLGRLFRRVDERHELVLYQPEDVERLLAKAGFSFERLASYGSVAFSPGWSGWAAVRI